MEPSLSIQQRLLHFFLAMGAQQKDSGHDSDGLTLLLGDQLVRVSLIKAHEIMDKNKIIESILSLSSQRPTNEQLYLAAPKVLGASIDASIFRSHGIGLILYDARRIEEVVPPQPLFNTNTQTSAERDGGAIISELAALKSSYLEMQENVAKLKRDLNKFQQSTRTLEYPPHVEAPAALSTASMIQSPALMKGAFENSTELPSFFTNNPWLEVLSKRGRVEEQIAA